MTPLHGPPGTRVVLHGEGFDPGPGLVVRVGTNDANVLSATTTAIEFQLPSQAVSALVEFVTGGLTVRYPIRFQVTRQVAGRFAPPAGVSFATYDIAGFGPFASPDATTGAFTIQAPTDRPFVVWAFQDKTQPAFAAVVSPSMTEVTIDAASTARALVFSSPGVSKRDPAAADALLTRLDSLPQTAQLAGLITAAASQGRDYLNDSRVETAWAEIAQVILSSLVPAPQRAGVRQHGPLHPKYLFLKDLNPDYSTRIPATLISLKSSLVPEPNDAQGRARFKLDGEDPGNNVDWVLELFQVDPRAYPGGLADIQQLTHSNLPPLLSLTPIATGVARAKLQSENADLPAVLMGLLLETVAGSTDKSFATDEFVLPSQPPGIYISHAYSGNLWYGTHFFLTLSSQADLIGQLGGDARWREAFAANLVFAALDLASVIIPAAALVDDPKAVKAVHEVLHTVFVDVSKALEIYQQTGQLDARTAYDLFKTTVQALLEGLIGVGINAVADSGEDEGVIAKWVSRLGRYGAAAAQTIAKSIDVFAKIASVEQAAERSWDILTPGALAIERSIMVIGSPFAPRITSFFPQSGRGGEVLSIQGANFSSGTNEPSVSFRTYAGTDDPNSYTKRVELQLLAATPTSIAALVPTNAYTEFPNGRAFLVVERSGSAFVASSAALPAPYYEFQFPPPPTITSVFPDPVRPGGILELRGSGFDSTTIREFFALIDGVAAAGTWLSDHTRMAVELSSSISVGTHTVAIKLRDYTSPAIQFQVREPAYVPPRGGGGLEITVNRPDFSNMADGKISVLEAILIAKGQLGRPIEQHLPCESPTHPNPCPRQERETDYVNGDSDSGGGGGPGVVDTITFSPGLIIPGALPPLSDGDNYWFSGSFGTPVTLDGSSAGAGADGILLDGTSSIRISGRLIIQNFSGHGVHLRNGAQGNWLEGITISNCTGNAFLIEGGSTLNELRSVSITKVAGHGIHITGAGTRLNVLYSQKGIDTCTGNGVRLDDGANFNAMAVGNIRNCQSAGVYIGSSSNNFFGRISDEAGPWYDVVNNNGPGVHLGPGAVGNVLRYLNPIDNRGDGVLLEGPGCSNNIVDRTYAGVNRYEPVQARTIANQGSGIRLATGAQFNLIGSRVSSFGDRGSISGNRDDGICLEGADTAFNTVNAQIIGVIIGYGPSGSQFAGNGRSGIVLRSGAHDNTIGDVFTGFGDGNSGLANTIFACPLAGIELAGAGTERNLVFGNQIGAHFSSWVVAGAANRCNNGVWIHDGPKDNTIGLPGGRIRVRQYPGDPFGPAYQTWNAINTCSNAGVLIENAGGTVQPDGALSGPNVIQANHIGELDNGNLAPSGGTGIKLGPGAHGNNIGGPFAEHGNRVRGWYRAGMWIDLNDLPSPQLRNRIENNYIDNTSSANFPTYLTQTPPGGVGFLVNRSSGHIIGESQLTKNTLGWNRFGVYLADSSNNVVRGFYITNTFNAGLTVRRGSGNVIGGNAPAEGNILHTSGFFNEPGWAGLTLSHTTSNVVRANEIGFVGPGRGAVGMFITNAAHNQIGGPAKLHGNTIISNSLDGILISGTDSMGNKVFNNYVGRTRAGVPNGNGGNGIRIEGGAHDNFIGGSAEVSNGSLVTSVISENVIANNGQAGVRVSGPTTVGNRILYNVITANGGKGILHENSGNHLHPSPVMLTFDGRAISGRVGDLAVTPPGSIIQIFSDPNASDPEGDAWFDEAIVQADGKWRGSGLLAHANVSMTATHVDGSTSEFGTGTSDIIGIAFRIERTDTTAQGNIAAGAVDSPVFRLSLSAINADVRVSSVALDTTGSLPDSTAISGARLYRDNDQDGTVTPADSLLSGPIAFGTDDGRITFRDLGAFIEANSMQRWLVAYSLASNAPAGTTFQLILTNQTKVDAKYINPVNAEAVPVGNFPIESANITVRAVPTGQTFAGWAAGLFSPQQLADPNVSGVNADPDEDGLNNFGEYAFNLNPLQADRNTPPTDDRGLPQGTLTPGFFDVTFIRRKEPSDITYFIEHSSDLQAWLDALSPPAAMSLYSQTDVAAQGTLERVTYRAAQLTSGNLRWFVRVRAQQKP